METLPENAVGGAQGAIVSPLMGEGAAVNEPAKSAPFWVEIDHVAMHPLVRPLTPFVITL
jgi:hypothetical protein